MKHNIIFLIVAVFLVIVSTGCEEQQLKTYDGDYFVQFEKKTADSTNFSFMFYPGKDYIDYPIPLQLVGVASDKNMTYRIMVDEKSTSATSQHYSVSEQQTFRAGRYVDTLYVRLNNTDDLKQKKVRLELHIESTPDLKIGKIEQSVAILWISNTVAKPLWWNSDIDTYYLGTYSNKKYELFIQVTGVYDLTGMDASLRRSHALKFKQYLSENPTLDENNQYIEVPVF